VGTRLDQGSRQATGPAVGSAQPATPADVVEPAGVVALAGSLAHMVGLVQPSREPGLR
jgi:hypothetical protein